MKTNIKMKVTPEQSKAVQKICFANNTSEEKELKLKLDFLDAPYLFISNGEVLYTHNTLFYNKQKEEEVDADLFIRTNGTCIEPTETLTEECQFAKYGFEKPYFECEILKEYDDHLVGAVYQNEAYFGTSWTKKGTCLQSKDFGYTNMNLKPIKKPWYETCKFPCVIMADYCMPVVVKHYDDGYVYDFRDNKYCVKQWRLITNDEIEGLKQ